MIWHALNVAIALLVGLWHYHAPARPRRRRNLPSAAPGAPRHLDHILGARLWIA
jgi:hypothetical protein